MTFILVFCIIVVNLNDNIMTIEEYKEILMVHYDDDDCENLEDLVDKITPDFYRGYATCILEHNYEEPDDVIDQIKNLLSANRSKIEIK